MKILLSGSTGFIGAPLFAYWKAKGHELVSLRRACGGMHSEKGACSIYWDLEIGLLAREDVEGFDAVVHLAGEPIGGGRWTLSKKEKILSSRIVSTRLLSDVLAQCTNPPRVFISVSAVGFYGDRGEEVLDERAPCGAGFLPSVCSEWERAAQSIEHRKVRVVHPRFGLVLGSSGGLLKMLLSLYKAGLGAILGEGNQWVSWIELYDLISALDFVLNDDRIKGAVNFVAPEPVRQRAFAQQLAHFVHRPCFFQIPAWFLRLAFGQAAEETLLASARAIPKQLLERGFHFRCPSLQKALSQIKI